MATKPEKKPASRSVEDFEGLVHDAVSSCGSFRPETVGDVLKAEAEGAGQSEESRTRRAPDPYDLLRRGPKGSYSLRPLDRGADEQAAAAMARAAREGREIPAEIEERMRRDREAAEQQLRDRDER